MITTTNHDEHYARGLAVCQGEEMQDGRVAHYDDATQTWWAVSRRAVAELGRRMETDPDAYSEWCADTSAEELGEQVEVPRGASWIVPPRCQGQIVEVAYLATVLNGGTVVRRISDRSERTVRYERADGSDLALEPWNDEPQGLDWEPCVVLD